jgi:aminoglycoside phosphotransferase
LLRRLAHESDVPAPRLLDHRDGWLLLEALPGVPLHDGRWLDRPEDAVRVIAEALLCLDRNDVRHGDMCVPNILGDLATSSLSGIVDWRYAGRFDREVDVASAIWSCGYNGYRGDVPAAVLGAIGWPRADAVEVERLSRVWIDLAGPADERSS